MGSRDVMISTSWKSLNKFWILWISGLVIWLASLFFFSQYDLEFSINTVDISSIPGRFIERFGEWPMWFVFYGSFIFLLLRNRLNQKMRQYLPLAKLFIIQVVIHPILITRLLKQLWGRIRFRDITYGLLDYSDFYLPQGIGVGKSFPSGHVAMILMLTPLIFYFFVMDRKIMALLSFLVITCYGLIGGYYRIVMGAHYLTDCIFSFGCSYLVASLISRLMMKNAEI